MPPTLSRNRRCIRLYLFLTWGNQCVGMIFGPGFYMSKIDIIWWHLKFWMFFKNPRCHRIILILTCKNDIFLDVIRLYWFLTCKNQRVKTIFEADFYMSKINIIWWHLKKYHFYMSKINIIRWHLGFWEKIQNFTCHQIILIFDMEKPGPKIIPTHW